MEPLAQVMPDDTWEQWCVLSDRPYVKYLPRQGQEPLRQECLLNEANCRQILRNFARSKDDLPATQRHDKGEALAFHNALALVVKGQVAAMEAHGDVRMPTLADLPGSDRGEPPEDGIYVHRYQITHLGIGKVGVTLKKISPEFYSKGLNEHGDLIGYVAEGSTYTNYPFLPGNEAQFETSADLWHLEKSMDPQQQDVTPEEMAQVMQKAGIAPGDDLQTAMMKMCRMNKMEKAAATAPAAVPGQPAAKPPAGPPTQMENGQVEPPVQGQTPPGQAAAAPAPSGGAPTVEQPGSKPGGENGPSGAHGGVTMERLVRGAVQQAVAPLQQELAAYRQREAQRAKTEQTLEADAWAMERGMAGCIRVRRAETEEQALKRIAGIYAASGKKAAEDALDDPGTNPAIGHAPMLHTYTKAGVPLGWKDPASQHLRAGERPDQALVRMAKEKQAKEQGFTFERALGVVRAEHPDLVEAYQDPTRNGLYPVGFQA